MKQAIVQQLMGIHAITNGKECISLMTIFLLVQLLKISLDNIAIRKTEFNAIQTMVLIVI